MDLELNTPTSVEVAVESAIDEIDNLVVSIDGTDALDVTFDSNEFSIVGDDMVVVTKYDDAPMWLKNTIANIVDIKTAVAVGDLEAVKESLDVMLGELEVAKNTYELSIISSADIDSRINTSITTLNSSLQEADATILEIAQTATTPAEASAIAINTLSASLSANGEIGSAIHNLESAMATLEGTTAESISYLESTMEGEINGNASAMQTIRTYVGIDEVGASTGTGLSGYLEGSDGTIGGADSQLVNDIKVNAEVVESKWAYNSTLMLAGKYYKSGFGLESSVHTSGSGTQADPYTSEFWIDASKFKFTNSAKTGSKAPFTIDATGPQPEITFNGKVTFGSGQTGTIDEAIAAVVETVAVGDKNINITDNLIPITSLVADTDNSGYQFIGTPTKSNTAGIDTYAEAQIVLDGSDEVYSPYVDDTTISYYYRFGIKGITNGSVFKIVTINSSNVATNNTVTITMNSGQSITAGNWYIIEGMINPTGGSSAAVGSIRNSSGVKIGTVSSLALPSGTSKVVLGWVANCTVSRIKLCKITADTVTSDLTTVNGQISTLQSNIDNVSWSSLQGKDLMAQQLGYTNYNALVSAASTGTTLINGGYINTGLIQTNAITAGMINTNGLIAENISASTINGKTITGSTISGAVITGAIVKASYLDLDGELEVLTNYHITPAMYNANPSYYRDAVYVSGSNEYRIPSISNILNSISKVQQISEPNPTWRNIPLSGGIYSYNVSNVGNNNKCVKIRPRFNILTEIRIMDTDIRVGGGEPNDLTVDFCYIKVCGVNYARVYQYYLTSGWWYIKIADSLTGTIYTSSVLRWDSGDSQWTAPYTFSATVSSGLVIKVTVQSVSHWEIYLEPCSVQVQHDYTSGELVSMDYLNRNYPVSSDFGYTQAYTIVKEVANTISVNNMI